MFGLNRGAPGASLAKTLGEGFTGLNLNPYEVIDGPLDMLKHIGKSALPFTLQGALEGEQPLTMGFAFSGARTSEETPFDRKRDAREDGQRSINAADYVIPPSEENPGRNLEATQKELAGDYKDMDRDLRAAVDATVSPHIQEEADRRSRELGSEIQVMKGELQLVTDYYQPKREAALAEGPSKWLRNRLSQLNQLEHTEKEVVRRNNQEALDAIDELDPREGILDEATAAYMLAIGDEALENDLGQYDFELREANVSKVRAKYGDPIIDEVIRLNHADESDLEKELRLLRVELRPYWAFIDQVGDRTRGQERVAWNRYNAAVDGKTRDVLYPDVADVFAEAAELQLDWLEKQRPGLETDMLKWEYRTGEPITNAGAIYRDNVERRVLQGGSGNQAAPPTEEEEEVPPVKKLDLGGRR